LYADKHFFEQQQPGKGLLLPGPVAFYLSFFPRPGVKFKGCFSPAVAMLHYPLGKGQGQLSAMAYTILNKQTIAFWRNLCKAMAIRFDVSRTGSAVEKRKHDLLLDGPVDN
jgi:hypothetical protein